MYGFNSLREISKAPFEISHKILNPYTTKHAFYEVLKIWQVTISQSYDILSLSETGPRGEHSFGVCGAYDWTVSLKRGLRY